RLRARAGRGTVTKTMADILDQQDNELDLYGEGELETHFSERDVLGDDDENDLPTKEGSKNSVKNGVGKATVVQTGNDTDLYDAAIEPSGQHASSAMSIKSETPSMSRQTSNASVAQSAHPTQAQSLPALGASNQNQGGRRYCCYIGNMTWWTTDVDLQTLILSCGASDLIDIKFYENRNNGQSKGFALAVFGMESAVKTVMEKLPQKTLHGQQLVVLPYTKASLAKFEDATRRLDQRPEKKESKKEEPKGPFVGTIRLGMPPQPLQPTQMSLPPPITLRPQVQVQVPPPIATLRPPAQVPLMIPQQQPPQIRAPPPTSQPLQLGGIAVTRPPINLSAPPPTIPQVQLGATPPQLNRPPPAFTHAPQGVPPISTSAPMAAAPPTSHPPPGFPPPGAHINPQVYRQNFPSAVSIQGISTPTAPSATAPSTVEGMSEAEFEEIMNRNRTVSSSAITRAVSDAAANDYASAIETLVTAISLIRQSRVSNDDRCKVLISSLQDTLNGIESKSYNSSSRKHRSTRDRSRSPSERSRKRHRRSSRSRSRSRERYEYSPRHSSSSNRRQY
uniref:RRM domain-containing protein n=1 Tax=Parascaris univalens TaxID=6257 RepID=A0A914ZIA2_PARUN